MARTARQSRHLKKRFLEVFGQIGILTRAADEVGIDRNTVYYWQEHDELFAIAFQQAELRATEVLETEARRRALEGVGRVRRVYQDGRLVDEYTETNYSDTLLIFLLKARAPEKYRERHDVTSGGQPLQASHASLDEAIERRLAELATRREGEIEVAASGPAEATDS